MEELIIDFKDVSKKYLGISYNFSIYKNDFVLIYGKNGIGKTTLIKLILGYIKKDKGYIYKKDLKYSFLSEKTDIYKELNGRQFLSIISKIKNGYIESEMIEELKINLDKTIKDLSKGNIQKISLLASFIGDYDVLVLDEPLSGLDDNIIKTVIKILIRLNLKGKTIICISHNKDLFKDFKIRRINLC